jgi:DNA-binding CsgD family transcriptional regulator/tetratricopeptide (TPR) repeat protein
LAVARAEVERAAGGGFRCLLLLGEAGVGKTRLARELLTGRVTGLSARAYPLGGASEFGLWAEALEGQLRGLPAAEVSALCAGFLDDLAVLVRSVAAARGQLGAPGSMRLPPAGAVGEQPRSRLLAGLAALLAGLAGRAPLVVLLDDVHLADASSWAALEYLARNLAGAPVLVVATARRAELADRPFGLDVLAALEQEGCLRRLSLDPLPPPAVRRLTESVLPVSALPAPPALLDWLDERARGNPLYLLGLLRALLDAGADLAAPALRTLPEALTGQVARRVRALDPAAVDVLELLAVLGGRVELRGLVGPSERPTEVLATALDTLSRHGLVAEQERGPDLSYEVAHPLIQEAVYLGIGAVRRRLLHRRAGQALLDAGRLGGAAPHFAAAAQPGDPEAVAVLVRAVRQAEEREAYPEALEILASLVELLPAGDPRWREVVAALSWRAQWVVDHRADAHAALGVGPMRRIDAVLAGLAAPAERAVVKFRLASFLAWGSGELDEAAVQCRLAGALFTEAGDRGSALLAEHELAWIGALAGDLGTLGETAARIAAEAGAGTVGSGTVGGGTAGEGAARDRTLLLRATRSLILVEHNAGRFAAGDARVTETISLARAAEDGYAEVVGRCCRAIGLIFEGRCAEAVTCLPPDGPDAEWADPVGLNARSMAHWCAGDFAAAVSSGLDGLTEAPGALSRRRGLPLFFTTLAAIENGRYDVAQRLVARGRATYRDRDWFVYSHWMTHAEALLRSRTGPVEVAKAQVAVMSRTAARLREMGSAVSAALVLTDLAELADAQFQLALEAPGDGSAGLASTAAAAVAARGLTEIAADLDRDFYRGMADTAVALGALVEGEAEAAELAAGAAARRFAGLGCRAHQGRALHVLGRALAPREPDRAVPVLRQAAELFADCGAPWRQARTLDELTRLGGPGRRAGWAVRGAAALTRREREVARLAARGCSAREIAARLFIGERTVETHLGRVYAKLGVGSKPQLAARATEFEL